MKWKRKIGKAKFYWKQTMAFTKRYGPVILLLIVALLLPAILWVIGSRNSEFIESGYGAILSYFGVLFGILGSFLAYHAQRVKEAKERRRDSKSQFEIDFKEYTDKSGIYTLRIMNIGKNPLIKIFVNGEWVCARITDTHAVTIICKSDDYCAKDNCIFIEPDDEGYPQFIQICCNDMDNNIWAFDFKKRCSSDRIYYYPEDSYII